MLTQAQLDKIVTTEQDIDAQLLANPTVPVEVRLLWDESLRHALGVLRPQYEANDLPSEWCGIDGTELVLRFS
jgi:hypothetical protein